MSACVTIANEKKNPETRINQSLTANAERRVLIWMAERAPRWIHSDHLTAMGLAAQFAAGALFAVAWNHRILLAGVVVCIALNWLGDSLDGTLARVRNQQRPRYGFYVDHVCDVLGTTAMMAGLALSGFMHVWIAAAVLTAFLILAAESYLATHTLGRFELSQGVFGPTELRLVLIAGVVALMRSPYSVILGQRLLLFDVGGAVAAALMLATALRTMIRHTAQLYREEPVR